MKIIMLSVLLCLANFIGYTQNATKTQDSLISKPRLDDLFSATPARVFFNLDKGQMGIKKIVVTNYTSDTMQMKLYFSDWLRDTIGAHSYYEAGKLQSSCARWLTLNKTFLELQPKEKQEVEIRMDIPDSVDAVKEMKWTMLMVESKGEKTAPKKNNLQLYNVARIGIHVCQTPPSLTNMELKVLNFYAIPGSNKEYGVVCQNVGNCQFDARSYIELTPLNEDGKKITIEPKTFPVFPGQRRYIKFSIPESVAKGKYNAVAIVEAGSEAPLEAAQAIIEVK